MLHWPGCAKSSDSPTLAVLAGGAGLRMGLPKAQLRIDGVPLIEYLLGELRWNGPVLLITSPGRTCPPGAGACDREVVDQVAGEGPLRGVLTAITSAETSAVVCVTVDMPDIESTHVQWVANRLKDHDAALGVLCARQSTDGETIEPFPCAFRRVAETTIRAALDTKQRSLRGLLRETGFVKIATPIEWPQRMWTNLNYPADLAEFLAGRIPPKSD